MRKKKVDDGPPFLNHLAAGEPITHFTYEFQGPRAVDPLLLVNDGVVLWKENVARNKIHDNAYLWNLATEIVENPQHIDKYSWVEWARHLIIHGMYTPSKWRSDKPFQYKGLLISAIYFQEARRMCLSSESDRAWHLIALAYYHLGLNTNFSTSINTSRAAKSRHAQRSKDVREFVLIALGKIRNDGSAKSVEAAKDQVANLLRIVAEAVPQARKVLAQFDKGVPSKTKGRTLDAQENDVIQRIRNLLDTWSLPGGPYPEIAEAFAYFSKRRKKTPSEIPTDPLATPEGVPLYPSPGCYLRVISHLGNDADMNRPGF